MSQVITPDQCRMARRELGLSQADVAGETGLNRVYISDFENGGTNRLTTGQQKKLVEFLKGKLEEAQENGEEIELTFGEQRHSYLPKNPHESVKAQLSTSYYFELDSELPPETIEKSMDFIESVEAKLIVLGEKKLERDEGLFGDGDLTEETKEAIQDAIMDMAAGFLVFTLACGGWRRFIRNEVEGDPISLRDSLYQSFLPALQEAGLIQASEQEAGPETEGEGGEE